MRPLKTRNRNQLPEFDRLTRFRDNLIPLPSADFIAPGRLRTSTNAGQVLTARHVSSNAGQLIISNPRRPATHPQLDSRAPQEPPTILLIITSLGLGRGCRYRVLRGEATLTCVFHAALDSRRRRTSLASAANYSAYIGPGFLHKAAHSILLPLVVLAALENHKSR